MISPRGPGHHRPQSTQFFNPAESSRGSLSGHLTSRSLLKPLPKPIAKPSAAASPPPEPLSSPKEYTAEEVEKMRRSARAVVAELYATENSYLNGLLKIATEYELPMRELKNKLTRKPTLIDDLLAIAHVRQITVLSQKIVSRLKDKQEPIEIPPVFLELAGDFDVYHSFVLAYSESMELLSKLMKTKPKIAAFLDGARGRCAGLSLDSLMITPIQRIPRYILLLREMIKQLPETDPAVQELEKAMSAMQKVADGINEAKRQEEQYQELIEISTCLLRCPLDSSMFVVRGRSFSESVPNCEWVYHDKQKTVPCQIMIFSDLILVTDAPDDQGRLVCQLCWFYKHISVVFPTDQHSWGFHAKIYSRLGTAVYIKTPYDIETILTPSAAIRDHLIESLSAKTSASSASSSF